MLISCSTLLRDPNPNLVLYCDLVRVLRRLRDGRARLFFSVFCISNPNPSLLPRHVTLIWRATAMGLYDVDLL